MTAKCGTVVNLERGAAKEKLAGIRKSGEFVEAFDGVADGVEKVVAGQGNKVAPSVFAPLAGKDPLVFLVQLSKLLIFLREQTQKEQIRDLLDRVHGVVDPAGIKHIHQLVHLLPQAGRKKVGPKFKARLCNSVLCFKRRSHTKHLHI